MNNNNVILNIYSLDGKLIKTENIGLKDYWNSGAINNGIYIAKDDLDSWERASDMLAGSDATNAAVFVEEGDTNAGTSQTNGRSQGRVLCVRCRIS